MKNTAVNLSVIKKIASALGVLNDRVVYVGGAVVGLYINDPAAEDVRPTKDIDISLSIASLGELEEVRAQLIQIGFIQTADDNIVCRFRYEDIKVDVMNTKALGWAPANEWFAPGFIRKQQIDIGGNSIYILPLPYFLASKFSAYDDRGSHEPRTSSDFEDIVYIFDNRTDIVEQFLAAPDDVKPFLRKQIKAILKDRVIQEAVLANLFYETRDFRFRQLMSRLQQIIQDSENP